MDKRWNGGLEIDKERNVEKKGGKERNVKTGGEGRVEEKCVEKREQV